LESLSCRNASISSLVIFDDTGTNSSSSSSPSSLSNGYGGNFSELAYL
jgi:hypothetical protein